MIPLTLQLKNFLSYGPVQTVNFAPYHLMCLSGKNGHGKSALLDAITWAIWGQARKTGTSSKADEGLMRLGQTDMMVSLDFMSNDQTYRVRREYLYTNGKPYAYLDCGIIEKNSGVFKPLTSKTIRTTQEVIDKIIGLSYESFINSVFLRQGHSNEFSKKSPKDRKEILCSILGLDHYESIRKHALIKMRTYISDKEHITKLHARIVQEIQQKELICTELTTLQQTITINTTHEQQIHQELEVFVLAKQHLQEQATQQQLLQFQYTTISQTLAEQQQLVRDKVQEWRTILKKYRSLNSNQTPHNQKNRIEAELAAIQEIRTKRIALKEQELQFQKDIHTCVQKIRETHAHQLNSYIQTCHNHENVLKNIQAQITLLKETLQKLTHEHEQQAQTIKNITAQHTGIPHLETSLVSQEKQFERRKTFYHLFVAQANRLSAELVNLKHKQELAHDIQNPSCALCEQNLSAARKRFLHTKFAQQELLFNHQLARLSRVIKNLKQLLLEQHTVIQDIKKQTQEQARLALLLIEINKNSAGTLLLIEEQQKSLQALVQTQHEEQQKFELARTIKITHEQSLDTKVLEQADYQILQKNMHALEIQYAALEYNPEYHESLQKQLVVVQEEQQAHEIVRAQNSLQEQRKRDISQLCVSLKKLKKEAEEIVAKLSRYTTLEQKKLELSGQESTQLIKLRELTQEKELLIAQKGALEQKLHTVIQHEQEYKEQQIALIALDSTIAEHQAIAQALSKDGVQALLIENALPEIEQEANNVLSKLTDNQAQIMIESLRDLKSGGTKETLDIKISDSIGIRPYELFSGGEAFRIDFALRIAISKLLARRAGTSLQTLIIDEGFGSQDEEGLAHIMDALYKIQDDFAKIIIVSHLPSMKEQFPIHLFIQKGPEGSTVQVIDHG